MSNFLPEKIPERMADIAAKLGLPRMEQETEKWGDGTRELSYLVLNLEKGIVAVSLSLPVEGMPEDLFVQREGYSSALMAEVGLEEMQVGEADFDDAFWVASFEPEPALAWLTPERRELLLSLFLEKDLQLLNGRVTLDETLSWPTFELVEQAWEVLRRTQQLLLQPPPVQPHRAPRDINRRRRAQIYRPLVLAAAICAAATLLIPDPKGQAGLACCAAWLGTTAGAWWGGRREAYPMLKVCRWLLALLALALSAGLVWWQYRRGESSDAFFNALVAVLLLLLGHHTMEMKMMEASRIRLGPVASRRPSPMVADD